MKEIETQTNNNSRITNLQKELEKLEIQSGANKKSLAAAQKALNAAKKASEANAAKALANAEQKIKELEKAQQNLNVLRNAVKAKNVTIAQHVKDLEALEAKLQGQSNAGEELKKVQAELEESKVKASQVNVLNQQVKNLQDKAQSNSKAKAKLENIHKNLTSKHVLTQAELNAAKKEIANLQEKLKVKSAEEQRQLVNETIRVSKLLHDITKMNIGELRGPGGVQFLENKSSAVRQKALDRIFNMSESKSKIGGINTRYEKVISGLVSLKNKTNIKEIINILQSEPDIPVKIGGRREKPPLSGGRLEGGVVRKIKNGNFV